MAKYRAGKCQPAAPGNALLSAFYSHRKLQRERNTPEWKLSQAATSNRFLLVGKPQR